MEFYNAAEALLADNLSLRAAKFAYTDDAGTYTYAELGDRVDRFAGLLGGFGIGIEARVLLCLEDGIDFPVACLGAIKAGVIPVMVNPLLTTEDYRYLIADSRVRAVVASTSTWPRLGPALDGYAGPVLIAGGVAPAGTVALAEALAAAQPRTVPAATRADEPCLWQYSSGSTGRPKGTIHLHSGIAALRDLYPQQVLGLSEADVTFSAAKLFFGYGFGNGLVFPLAFGATAVLMAGRPTPEAVWERLVKHRPSIFYGVPTLYNSLLAYPEAPLPEALALRLCVSAGEALPVEIARRWTARYGLEILDGIGSTEMLHIFLSNRPGDVVGGTTGRPLAGVELKLLDDAGQFVPQGETGELHIKGPTAAAGYWCSREKTQATFCGEWVRSGDKFRQDENGRFIFCGRSDDMLKVSGIYVSPLEVEAALMAHPLVREAAVIGWADDAGLIKPKAYVVLVNDTPEEEATETLRAHVKALLAPYKYPRWIEFLEALPKTATGKIERYKLRVREAE